MIRRLLVLALLLPQPSCAEGNGSDRSLRRDLTIEIVPLRFGDAAVRKKLALDYRLFPGVDPGRWREGGRAPSIPVIGVAMEEGPVLETILWGGTGAMVGSLGGPLGTLVGAAVGSACGYVIGCLYAPKAATLR